MTPLTRCYFLASGLAALPFSCEENYAAGITVSGVVIEEEYIPASSAPSQYFFFIEREGNRQAVQVNDYSPNGWSCGSRDSQSKESVDFLAAPGGTRVEISGLTPEELQRDLWQVEANRIRVYQLEE